MFSGILSLFTVVVYFTALGILKSALRNKNNVDINLKALTLHCIAFLLLAITYIYDVVAFIKAWTAEKYIQFVDATIAATFISCVSGSILAYIFLKIYLVEKQHRNLRNNSETTYTYQASLLSSLGTA